MFKFIEGFIAGVLAVFVGGWMLCEVAEHCDLPLEIPEDNP